MKRAGTSLSLSVSLLLSLSYDNERRAVLIFTMITEARRRSRSSGFDVRLHEVREDRNSADVTFGPRARRRYDSEALIDDLIVRR